MVGNAPLSNVTPLQYCSAAGTYTCTVSCAEFITARQFIVEGNGPRASLIV